EEKLTGTLHPFLADRFNPGLPVAGNLLFAVPTREIAQEDIAKDTRFRAMLRDLKLEDELLDLGQSVLGLLSRVFGMKGTDHPMFVKLGIDAEFFEKLTGIERSVREQGLDVLDADARGLLMTVPFRFTPERMGAPFPDKLRNRILEIRAERRADLLAGSSDLFEGLNPDGFAPGLTVLENAIFGKPALAAGVKGTKLRDLVAKILIEDGLQRDVARLIYDVRTDIAGSNLPQQAQERVAFSRAAIRRPDVLVLDQALSTHAEADRRAMRERLRALLPDSILIFIEESLRDRSSVDQVIEIEEGRVVGSGASSEGPDLANDDFSRKLRALERTELFGDLERRQLRLLAFASRWVTAGVDEKIFQTGEEADSAYLLVDGTAELRWAEAKPGDRPVTRVEPGRMIGDLSVLQDRPRQHDFVATSPLKALRVGGEELRAIIQNDPDVANAMLRTVAGYLVEVGGLLRDERRAHATPGEGSSD
ncbi:MAG: cyclic nucleotide-binding domain-containing protein, partial [Pseudomonadota bacterium]